MESKRLKRVLAGLGLAALAGVLLYILRGPLTPVGIAIFLAYLLDPLIDRFELEKWNRSVAILVLAAVASRTD